MARQHLALLAAAVVVLTLGVFSATTVAERNRFAGAPPPQEAPGRNNVVMRLDPALDDVISTTATLETLKEDYFGATEGPVWSPQGFLLFSDIGSNRVYRWTPGVGLAVHVDHAGFAGDQAPITNVTATGRFLLARAGPNGLTLDREGRLIICAHGDRALVRIEKDGTRNVIAAHYQGKRLNGPNDVVLRKSDGSLYFTDRGSGLRGREYSPDRELAFRAIMRWRDGALDVVDDGTAAGEANGLAFSPDEKYLYTAVTGTVVRFDVLGDGKLGNPRVHVDMRTDKSGPGNPDGIKVDLKGNVFTGGPGGIWIVSPQGKLLGKILLPVPAANLAFGDPDGRGLYITAGTDLYRIRLTASAL